jgi:hypothetical protein
MKFGKSLFRFGVLMGAFLFAASVPQAGFAQTDPFIGTWKINLAKSTYKPGPPPQSVVFSVDSVGPGLRAAGEAVDGAGMTTHLIFTIVYDGKTHPVTGSPTIDGNAVVKTGANMLEYANTKAGVLVATGTITFAADGRSLTISTRTVNPAGQRVDNLAFYDKQ